jgi:apolipoprotein D and lipocalin family protein
MWVLWMDSGARTALVATPEGDKVLVLDRHAQGGVDRVAAARVVMGWQGFDLAAMDLN